MLGKQHTDSLNGHGLDPAFAEREGYFDIVQTPAVYEIHRAINHLKIHRVIGIHSPVVCPAKICACRNFSQKCSHATSCILLTFLSIARASFEFPVKSRFSAGMSLI